MDPRTASLLALFTEGRTRFTKVLDTLSEADLTKKLAPSPNSAGFLIRHIGQDYDHGTGHGVGAFLSVHEGPQRISRVSEVPLEPGMILSNELGYYREGAFGIRLENLIVVQEAAALGDNRAQMAFETLTFVPFDWRLILVEELSPGERRWLDGYHAEVLAKLASRVSGATLDWLSAACAPI